MQSLDPGDVFIKGLALGLSNLELEGRGLARTVGTLYLKCSVRIMK
jgi:hypothetical protein